MTKRAMGEAITALVTELREHAPETDVTRVAWREIGRSLQELYYWVSVVELVIERADAPQPTTRLCVGNVVTQDGETIGWAFPVPLEPDDPA